MTIYRRKREGSARFIGTSLHDTTLANCQLECSTIAWLPGSGWREGRSTHDDGSHEIKDYDSGNLELRRGLLLSCWTRATLPVLH